jgi:hypothetical protein
MTSKKRMMIAIIATTWPVLMRLGLGCFFGVEFGTGFVLPWAIGVDTGLTSAGDVKFAPQYPQNLAPVLRGCEQLGQMVDMDYSWVDVPIISELYP